jgi:hypothetical protein
VQGLVAQLGQVDIDSPEYRAAAARRVGLAIPDRLPLKESDPVSRYDVAAKLSQLKGVAGMRAQLYGIDAVLGTKRPAPASSDAARGAGTSVPPTSER